MAHVTASPGHRVATLTHKQSSYPNVVGDMGLNIARR